MFSLIITIISIALVAALAVATLYFGGDAFNKGDAQSRATQVVVQGQQVLAAADVFYADKGRWPNSMEELVSEKYLKQIPAVTAFNETTGGAVNVAHAAVATSWTMPVAGKPTFVLPASIEPETCKFINLKVRGDNGILAKAYTSLTSQCYGVSTSALKVVVTKDNAGLATVLPAAEVVTGDIPAHDAVGGWLSAPVATGVLGAGAGGAGGGGQSNPALDTSGVVTLTGENGGNFGTFPDYVTPQYLVFTVSNGTAAAVQINYAEMNGTIVQPTSTTCSVGSIAMGPAGAVYAAAKALLPAAYAPMMANAPFPGGPWNIPAGQKCTFTVQAVGNFSNSLSTSIQIGLSEGTTLSSPITGSAPLTKTFNLDKVETQLVQEYVGGIPYDLTAVTLTFTNTSNYTVIRLNGYLSQAVGSDYRDAFDNNLRWNGNMLTCEGPFAPGATKTCTTTINTVFSGGGLLLNADNSTAWGSTGPIQLVDVPL